MDIEKGIQSANNLFKEGKFAEARKLYLKILQVDPQNYYVLTRLGYIALLANRLNEAEKWLIKAIKLKPEEETPKSLLAETYYRQDKFKKAAPLLHAIGRKALARKLESFKDAKPYQIKGATNSTNVKFVITDPLPVVKVRVNNSQPVNFFIDTGGGEIIIDQEFAKEVGAISFGSETGVFAGGKKVSYHHGRVDFLTIGDFTIKNLPIHIMDIHSFTKPIFKETPIDGVIGTIFLYHFIPTLNYPDGQLTLQLKTEQNIKQIRQEAIEKKSIVIPFWMAGDHYIVAWGTVNKSPPMLFLVDTGLAGAGFTCPKHTIKEAGIKLQENQAQEGYGGGGKVKTVPFQVDELTLGEAKEHNIQGIYIDMPSSTLEKTVGFHIKGVISHTFFKHYALTFNFIDMKLLLKREN